MSAIDCRLTSHSLSQHLNQAYTGFNLLHKQGRIRLTQQCSRTPIQTFDDQHLANSGETHLRVLLNGGIRIHYDCHDSYEISVENLGQCDLYFKRSFSRPYVDTLPSGREKVHPLGLNYSVLPDFADLHALQRARVLGIGPREKLLASIEALDGGNLVRYSARLRDLEAAPDLQGTAQVLFLVNAYDPHDRPDRTKQKIEQYIEINQVRAQCIRLLRKNFGPRFLGGFSHTIYARRTYPDLLVERQSITRKRNYLKALKSYCICVATTGLHGSIGWKFAEYVALSKAVVSEPLQYEVPGNMEEGRNYLVFESPNDCAEACTRLMDDRDARARLMFNNALYYRSYVRPDTLVLNTLLQALASAKQPPRDCV